MNKTYMCIDLKSFYASVECNERGLDPLTTNLVVADSSRTEKTICLAVSPSLKQYGIPGRARLFEVIEKVKKVNYERKKNAYKYRFIGKSYNDLELKKNKNLELDYIVAPPRMAHYIKYSTEIYNIYLKYLAPEDIYVYSIDEVFCDITNYLKYYKMTAEELVTKIINDVYKTTGITATAGIGTNLYLAKVAMDIEAKKSKANEYGVRIAVLDENLYRKKLWNHKPLTDFWRVGKGYSKKLESKKIYTMGDIARTSIENEDLLFKLFGVNAEILIDHAWGYEPCTLKDIKSYKPIRNSLSKGQVLHSSYDYKKTKLVIKEMVDSLCLELVEKRLVTNKIVLTLGYDIKNLNNPNINYTGEIKEDYYGRNIPKPAHGTISLNYKTSSSSILRNKIVELYDKIIDKNLLVKRINIGAETYPEDSIKNEKRIEQIDLFSDYEEVDKNIKNEIKENKKEKVLQDTLLNIKNKYGKNSILRGMDYEEGATTRDRNNQIGGHKA